MIRREALWLPKRVPTCILLNAPRAESLPIDQALVDEQGKYNRLFVEPIVIPQRHRRRFTVSKELELMQEPITSVEQMIQRVLQNPDEFRDDKGQINANRIANFFSVSLSSKAYRIKEGVERRLRGPILS